MSADSLRATLVQSQNSMGEGSAFTLFSRTPHLFSISLLLMGQLCIDSQLYPWAGALSSLLVGAYLEMIIFYFQSQVYILSDVLIVKRICAFALRALGLPS